MDKIIIDKTIIYIILLIIKINKRENYYE